VPGDERGGSATGPPQTVPPTSATTGIAPDPNGIRSQACERSQGIDRRHRIAAMADERMTMAVYYGPQRPRPISLGRFLVEGWWVA
jgi:hypothetical protein